MKVTFFSTYPPAPCGIGDYARELRHAVERRAPELSVEVVAERHPAVIGELDARVFRAWGRRGAWDEQAIAAVIPADAALRPAVVHIQHEEAILQQNGRLIRFLRALGRAGIARVVTLHSVYGGRLGIPSWWPPPVFHRALAAECEAIVVHQREGGRDTLERQGVPAAKIQVIPHGTAISVPFLALAARGLARQRLGIPADAKVALFFGVIHAKKNLHTVVAAAGLVAARVPGFRLVVAGRARERTFLDTLYARRLARQMTGGLRAGWLDLRRGFIPADALASYVAAADVVLFPHDQAYGSASGVFHHALGGGRACICSASPKFGEARELFAATIPGATVPTRDVRAWAASIESFLSTPALLRQAERLAERAAVDSSWDEVGRLHAELYWRLAQVRPGDSSGAMPVSSSSSPPSSSSKSSVG